MVPHPVDDVPPPVPASSVLWPHPPWYNRDVPPVHGMRTRSQLRLGGISRSGVNPSGQSATWHSGIQGDLPGEPPGDDEHDKDYESGDGEDEGSVDDDDDAGGDIEDEVGDDGDDNDGRGNSEDEHIGDSDSERGDSPDNVK
jgi:hypothetical protein